MSIVVVYHDLQIDTRLLDERSVPHGEFLLSCAFTVGGHTWRIICYPNGVRYDADAPFGYVSIYLKLDEMVAKPVTAQVQFSVMAGKRALFLVRWKKEVLSTKKTFVKSFAAGPDISSGYSKFTNKKDVLKKVRQGDPLTIRCHIVVFNGTRAVQSPNDKQVAAASVHVPPSNLHTQLGDLLSNKRGADVVFEVGGEMYPAHRCVLAARSPVFAVEFFSSMRESDAAGSVIHIDHMEPQVLQALLHIVYTDTLPEMRKQEEGVLCQHLLVAADRFDMERLKLICEDKLCRYIDAGTAVIILTQAEQHRCHCLKKACIDFLLSAPANLKAVVAGAGFEHLSTSCPSITKDLLAMHANAS